TGGAPVKPTLPGRYDYVEVARIIVNKRNIRDDAAAIAGIVENLEQDGPDGLTAPIILAPLDDDTYVLVDGEQRYWSAVQAEHEFIQAVVRYDYAGQRAQTIAMLRQVHRKDPTAVQQARGIQQLALEGMD